MVLRSKTPEGVLQEIYGYLCIHYALRTLIGEVAFEFGEDPLRVSFTRTLRATRRSMAGQPRFPPENLRQQFAVFCSNLLHELLPERQGRVCPRVVKQKMFGWLLKQVLKPVK